MILPYFFLVKTIIGITRNLYTQKMNTYLVSNKDIRKKCEIYSKLTINTPERRQWRCSGFFIANFEHISYLFFMSLSLVRVMFSGYFLQFPELRDNKEIRLKAFFQNQSEVFYCKCAFNFFCKINKNEILVPNIFNKVIGNVAIKPYIFEKKTPLSIHLANTSLPTLLTCTSNFIMFII